MGKETRQMTYADLVPAGEALVGDNLLWIFLGIALIVAVYIWLHRRIMHGSPH
jgi:uncharacterized membrane protein